MYADRMLVEYCSPTLGGLKTGNLFSVSLSNSQELVALSNRKKELSQKGVFIHILSVKKERALVYVYRKDMLEADLKKEGVREFLGTCGYQEFSLDQCIARVKKRLRYADTFPHEIGLFLGYPLKDVPGFIEHGGQNYKCIGDWKVYCDKQNAIKRFMKFQRCKETYTKLFDNCNWSVLQLTVAV
jgi:hypothetical protein